MFRFFVKPEQILEKENIIITGEDVQHIIKSIRLKPGDKVIICDGQGTDYLVELVELNKTEVFCKIHDSYPSAGEPDLRVTLLQGIPKGDKMDLIVQKATELGIAQIIPLETQRTIVKLNDQKSVRRLERWQKIAEEAAKQSDRGEIPQIGPIQSWKEALKWLKNEDFDLIIVPWEDAKTLSIRGLLHNWQQDHNRKPKKIAFLIGPEGGLAEDEVTEVLSIGGSAVTLGPRILRTETAGFAVLTVLMYEFDEMEGCDPR